MMSQDSQLQQSVLAELNWDPGVTAGHIGVTANAGVVTLTGHVNSYAEKHAAETAARRVNGVKAVAEEIEIQYSFDPKHSDDEIAAAVIARLSWNVSVPKNSVRVKVEKGWVTLTGQVAWWYQKEAAGTDIRPLQGIVGVSNQMTVTPRVDVAGLSDDITQALHRSKFFNPDHINVHADGGKVVLSGSVQSFYERDAAEHTAWSAPGTIVVQNDLTIV
jgi:osmotically-inducible protein OsmY